jgi:RNA polymerase sigma-70 factor, ECF subfamily
MTGRTAIRQAMAMLSIPHRAVIYRAYYLELTAAQIAAEYQIAESAVRAELHDAMHEFGRNLRQAHMSV